MNLTIDTQYLLDCFQTLVSTPSPVGYYVQLNPVLEQLAADLGLAVTFDNRNTAYITVDGEDNSKTVMLSAHADTIGLAVRAIDGNGMLRLVTLGGGCMPSLEGESVTVHTRDGRAYSGLVICQSHSTHVFDDAHSLERNVNTLRVLLDQDVHSKADVLALGIANGDPISVVPRCQVTDNGYIKSRYIDDKGAIACCFTALKFLAKNHQKPKYRTIFAFPHYEEIGLGGCFVPPEVSELVGIDIGLIGPDLNGSERAVSICAKDRSMPYDYLLTNRLIEYAKKAGCNYAVDVYNRYGSDVGAAMRGGNNIRHALFGMAVYCSHGLERTHVDGLENTAKLLLAYILDI